MGVNNPRRLLVIDCQQPATPPSHNTSDTKHIQYDKAHRAYQELDDLNNNSSIFQIEVLSQPSLVECEKSIAENKPYFLYVRGGLDYTSDYQLLKAKMKELMIPSTITSSSSMITLSNLNQLSSPSQELSDNNKTKQEFDIVHFAKIISDHQIKNIYLDALVTEEQINYLNWTNPEILIYWPAEPPEITSAVISAQFAHSFFGLLRNSHITISEAFSMASCVTTMFGRSILNDFPKTSLIPSTLPLDKIFNLPNINSVPLDPTSTDLGIRLFEDGGCKTEDWQNIRVLAPKAELRIRICGGSSSIERDRLSYLGKALRALLLTEMRNLELCEVSAYEHSIPHLPCGCVAIRCVLKSTSGGEAIVVLGAPPLIISDHYLIQLALRQALGGDSLCLQFRLPPPDAPLPVPKVNSKIARGTPVVDTVILTSVWAVHILKSLCQNPNYRGLISLGIAGIGSYRHTNFRPSDTIRFSTIVTGITHEPMGSSDEKDSFSSFSEQECISSMAGSNRSSSHPDYITNTTTNHNTHDILDKYSLILQNEYNDEEDEETLLNREIDLDMDYISNRPALSDCTEKEFYDDLVHFLWRTRGKPIDRDKFPEAVLNGVQLDLFTLYKEVCSRGGFRVGNGINWKGQVFPKMSNWTPNHKMTGVGNALKRHYQAYLVDYEKMHPDDVTGGGCALCGSVDDFGAEWICCDSCEAWVHFACDHRPHLGVFKDYATGEGRTYLCPLCSDVTKRQRIE